MDKSESEFQSTVEDFSTEIENGIFSMVITLCQHKAKSISIEDAKEAVALYLERIAQGLRYEEETPLKGKK